MNIIKRGRSAFILTFLLCFCLAGCSEEQSYPLASTYSEPKTGRVLDFGPEGLFAEKDADVVTVGRWTLDGKELKMVKLTHPARGESKVVEVKLMENEVRLNKPGSEFYNSLSREPAKLVESSVLVGLWKHESEEGIELYEFTPWGSCIWIRIADHTDEVLIAGGNGSFQTPRPGRLELLGTEIDYPLNGYDKYSLIFDGDDFVTTNLANKEKVRYIKVKPEEVDSLVEKILAAESQGAK